jgi:Zn-dependent protease with chaperone function
MKLDRANRSFLVLMGIGAVVGAFAVWGGIAGVLEPLIRNRVGAGAGPQTLVSVAPAACVVAVAAMGAASGVATLARHAIATARLSRQLRPLRAPLPAALRAAVADTGLGGRVILVDVPTPFSYVYHALRPRVVVSRGLLTALSDRQLRAVLEHERYHVVNLDPLKLALSRATRAALFTLPMLQTLQRRYLIYRELSADRRAVHAYGRDALVGALLRVIDTPTAGARHVVAAIADPSMLHTRIRQLETGTEPRPTPHDRTSFVCSLLTTATLVATFLIAVCWLGGPAQVEHLTGKGLVAAVLVGGALCTVPFAAAGLVGYALVAVRTRRAG